MEAKRIVHDWIDKNQNQIAGFLSESIRKASVNPVFSDDPEVILEQRYQEYIRKFLDDNGFETEMWEPDATHLAKYEGQAGYYTGRDFTNRPNVYGKLKGEGGGKSILLTGHADVVKAAETWTVDPFGGDIIDGKIYGRGAIDMKGGIVAMLAAVKAIRESGLKLKGDVKVGTVSDEENGGMGTRAFVDRGYYADACILTEPTDLDVQPLCRGILWGEVLIRGRSGHIELEQADWRDGGAVDAIAIARKVMDTFDKYNAEWAKTKTHPLISIPCQIKIAEINAGDYPTTYADQCKININVQYLPREKDELGVGNKVKEEVESIIREATADEEWMQLHPAEVVWTVDANCGETDADDPFVQTIFANAKSIAPETELKGLACHSDMGFFIDAGIPTVNFGPGDSWLAHQDDEFVRIDMLIRTCKIIASTIIDWCEIYEE